MSAGDQTLDLSTLPTILSRNPHTLLIGGGSISLEEFFIITLGAFDPFSPNIAYASAISKLFSVNSIDALTFNYDFIKVTNVVSSVLTGNDLRLN